MGLLNLSGILKTAGAGFAGYGADKQRILAEALQQRAAEREATNDAIANYVKLRGANKLQLGDAGYAGAMGDVAGAEAGARIPAALAEAKGLAPIHTAEAVATAQGVSPIHTQEAVNTAAGVAPVTEAAHAAITPYQQAQLDLEKQRLAQQGKALAAKAQQPTPDQIKSATVNALAGPAADILIGYHGGPGGAQQLTAAAAGHLPLVGHYLQGKVDPDFQNAMNAARTLATQYLEIMPKSRFQPSTVDDIMSQIAPNPGDSPQTRTAKLSRVRVIKNAIEKRAALRPDDPGPALDDVPEFPLSDGSN